MRRCLIFLSACSFADPVVGGLLPEPTGHSCSALPVSCLAGAPTLPMAPSTSSESTTPSATLVGVHLRSDTPVSLAGAQLTDVVIEAPELTLARSKLERVSIIASRVDISSSTLQDVSIQGEVLWATSLTGDAIEIASGRAALSSVELRRVSSRSRSLLLSDARIDQSWLGPCEDGLRIVKGVIATSALDGAISADATLWDANVFGASALLASLDDIFLDNDFCSASVSLYDASTLACNACAQNASICAEGVDLQLIAEQNPRCAQLAAPALCPAPPPSGPF
jgi:hypothetical protein